MLRAVLTAALAIVLTSCAHERARDPEHPAVVATAQFIIQAIALEGSEDYRWEAIDARISNAVRWSAFESGAAEGVEIRREGRLGSGGSERGVVALGDRATVGAFSIDTDAFHGLALLDALRAAGAEVSFQGDYESYSEYVVTPVGGDTALLTTNSTCILFETHPPGACRNYVTLTFNPW